MYFQLVLKLTSQVLSSQGQPDVFNLHRLTSRLGRRYALHRHAQQSGHRWVVPSAISENNKGGFKLKALLYPFHNQTLKPEGGLVVSIRGQLTPPSYRGVRRRGRGRLLGRTLLRGRRPADRSAASRGLFQRGGGGPVAPDVRRRGVGVQVDI